jgi:lipoprotein-anchoring transpeptidase ErfK/SrfK
MDSSTIGIPRNSPGGYYLPGVLYTQYFDGIGDALHYNYWSPTSAFGGYPTSHGCVGMPLATARFFWNFATYGTPVRIHY